MFSMESEKITGLGSLLKYLTDNYSDFQSGESAMNRFPPVNMSVSEDGVIVRTQAAGINPENISLTVKDDILKLTLKRAEEADNSEGEIRWIKRERPKGDFSRSVRLPYHVKTEQVNANFEKGILTVSLPRAEQDKPFTIPVQSVN